MNKKYRFLLIVAAMVAMLVSACGGTATETSAGGDKPLASLVEFTGVIEAMDGNQWTINGQVITVDPVVLRDGPFAIGDTVKVEAEVQADGSVIVTRVELPSANDNSNDNSNDDNSNDDNGNDDNGNDDNSNDDNGNDDNSNDDNGNDDNSNDDNGNDDNSNDDNGNDDDNSGSGGDDEDDDNSGSGGGNDDDD